MNNILKSLSKGTLAFICIGLGILVIVYFDPPHTLCNSEKTQLLESQKKFLEPDAAVKKAFKKAKSPQNRLYTSCKESENSGGCLEYFLHVKKFMSDYEVTSNDCRKQIFGDTKVKSVFNQSLKLMLNLAWGKAPPTEYQKKYGWFDQADIFLFCKIKDLTQKSSSESQWESQREGLLQQLSGAENLSREQLWKSSLLSISCKSYL